MSLSLHPFGVPSGLRQCRQGGGYTGGGGRGEFSVPPSIALEVAVGKWSPEALAKLRRTLAEKRAKRWERTHTTALSVTLPEWTGFALNAEAVKIAVGAESRVVILSPGRGGRALSRFVVQLPPGTMLELGPPSAAPKVKRMREAGPGLNQEAETRID